MMTNPAQFALRRSIFISMQSLRNITSMCVSVLFPTMFPRSSLPYNRVALALSSNKYRLSLLDHEWRPFVKLKT